MNWSMAVAATQWSLRELRKGSQRLMIGAIKNKPRAPCSTIGRKAIGPSPTSACAVAFPAMQRMHVCKKFILCGKRLTSDWYVPKTEPFDDAFDAFLALLGVGFTARGEAERRCRSSGMLVCVRHVVGRDFAPDRACE